MVFIIQPTMNLCNISESNDPLGLCIISSISATEQNFYGGIFFCDLFETNNLTCVSWLPA